ncbi:C_GCAxxG_C_C family protein [Pseudenhygromyxa sp. WMMC2535]|nr:C_GCAxxG_C_C family protein [Pseudenhygromyxa sp. WMMC2535]
MRSKALILYEGERTPHRSCGIALAETFDRPTAAYQSLRRGGITGRGTCGAVVAGQLILGEFLGHPDPTGPTTPALERAMKRYQARVEAELDRGASPSLICNDLTAPHGDFRGPDRHRFCTALVAQVAQLVDETLREQGLAHPVTPLTTDEGERLDFR